MNGFISLFYPSYVEGANCYQAQVENLNLSLTSVGERTNLRITCPINLHRHPRGICEGYSLIFARYCLQSNANTLPEFKKIRLITLKRHNLECFLIQHVQDALLGLHGNPHQELIQKWSKDIDQIQLNDPRIDDIRGSLIKMNEPLTPNIYATILEVEALYRAKVYPNESCFLQLAKDVLTELCTLVGLRALFASHFCGTEKELRTELDKLPKGVYHVGMKRHAWIFIVADEKYVCDVNFKIANTFNITLKKQWITISQLKLL